MDSLKQIVKTHWDGRAATFDEGASHGLLNDTQAAAWRRLMAEITGNTPLDILDVGCGTGVLSVLLAEAGHRVTGLDFSTAMLVIARAKAAEKRLPIYFIEADAESPPIPAAGHDLIIERHLLWTLPHPAAALAAWRKLLRPAGRLVLIEGHWGKGDRQDDYARIHDQLPLYGGRPAEEIAALVRTSGFAAVTVEPLMDPDLWNQPPAHPRYLIRCMVTPVTT